ncbi:MAG: Fic family protein [Candidatus Saccharimonadales bacterium]
MLLCILRGESRTADIAKNFIGKDVRSIQRSLARLTELGLVDKQGPSNNPDYTVNYANLVVANIPEKIFYDDNRPETHYNFALLDWLEQTDKQLLERLLSGGTEHHSPATTPKLSMKELEYLTVELSWKSSALEGNTYTLLDTQLLLTEGVKPKNRTEFETQMILNHKEAIAFIVENGDLFAGTLSFSTVEELHRIIGKNLGIESGVRKKLTRISASNYVPLAAPRQLRESIDRSLAIISGTKNPYVRALLALGLVPYLQTFEDGNKRTGRMLANALLIHSIGRGFSLRGTDARSLALAYLAFYEFNSLFALGKILHSELDPHPPHALN